MKKSFGARLRYWFDRMMSRGSISRVILLFAVMAVAVCIFGLVAYLVGGEHSLIHDIWLSFVHTLDAGTLAGNGTDNIPYLIMMTLATLLGLFVTSILIGIVATGVEDKVNDLRKGNSVVQENGHTVIIGFDDNVYTLLHELIEANANHKGSCVVVLGEQPKEEMEDAIASHIPDSLTTRIICRSGNPYDSLSLRYCSVESCRSVILNTNNDTKTVKTLLALSAYLKDKELFCKDLRFVATVQERQYVESAEIAAEGRAEIVFAKDAIARIISNTCRQHGLSQVLTELFDFEGDEIYYESVPQLTGKSFGEALMSFSNAVAIGIFADGKAHLNPPMDMIIGDNDRIILIEDDDMSYNYHPAKTADESLIITTPHSSVKKPDPLTILGTNDKLPLILSEYNPYVPEHTPVVIIDDDFDISTLPCYENLDISLCTEPVSRHLLCKTLKGSTNNVLLLNDDSTPAEQADAQTLLHLILLRDIADKTNKHFSITTEMHSAENQRLASQARVDDFVIGSNFASLLMAQISENPSIAPLIAELLDDEGSELYMKAAEDYAVLGVELDFYTLTESAARKGEIFVGYRKSGRARNSVVVNPNKAEKIILSEGDQVVVIAVD